MTQHTKPNLKYAAPAAACAADVLIVLARSEEPLSLSQLAERTECTRSLVHRVVSELEAREFVTRTGQGTYSLGVLAVVLGAAFSATHPLMSSIRSVLRKLAQNTGESASLAILRGSHVLYLMREEGERSVLTVSVREKLLPANAVALGKALLAEKPDDQVRDIYSPDGSRRPRLPAMTTKTITSLKLLLQDLAQTRVRGYAVDYEEAILGRGCVSVAVPLEPLGSQNLAISVSMVVPRLAALEREMATQLEDAKDRIVREAQDRAALGETSFSLGVPELI